MGIVLATAAAVVLCIVLMYICYEKDCEWLGGAFILFSFMFMTLLLVESFIIGFNFITKNADKAAYEQRYEALIYQLEEDIYQHELNGEGKRDLYREIERWNYDLAKNQVYHNSRWTNWFYPIDYDHFKYIKSFKNAD